MEEGNVTFKMKQEYTPVTAQTFFFQELDSEHIKLKAGL